MPSGRLVPLCALAVAALATGRVPAQAESLPMPKGRSVPCPPAAPAPVEACEPCQPACPSPQRIRVIVPEPEVVVRYCGQPSWHPFHRWKTEPCPAAPACAPVCAPAAPPGGGQLAFNMTYSMPFMSYQMSPMMMMSAGAFGTGYSSGMAGGSFAGGMPIQSLGLPLGGFPGFAAGGGVNSSLATLLALAGSGGGLGTSSSAADMQLLRALLNRSLPGTDGAASPAPPTRPGADSDTEAQIRRLNSRLDEEMRRMQQDIATGLAGIRGLLVELDKRLKKLEPPPSR